MSDSQPVPPRNLNAEVARAIWPEVAKRIDADSTLKWSVQFDRDLEKCREHMLPALERRGLGTEFYDALTPIAWNALPDERDTGFAVLQLPARAWCTAFLEVWGEG